MKKKLLLSTIVSTLGVAAGVLFVRGSNRRKQNGNGNAANGKLEKESELSANSQVQSASGTEASKSNGASRAASMAPIENGKAALSEHETQPVIDDQGTDQFEASQILKDIRDNAFDASDEKLALALGRPTEEIEEWTNGSGTIDGDVIMKARALAIQRGLEVE